MIGGYPVYLAREYEVDDKTLSNVDVVIPLNGFLPTSITCGTSKQIIFFSMKDHGGVPEGFKEALEYVVGLIKDGKKVLAYCTGSHGRTGCFAASLLTILEPDIDDPVQEIRNRHCKHAVESYKQIEAVFALKGVPVPKQHVRFSSSEPVSSISTRSSARSSLAPMTLFDGFGEDLLDEPPFDSPQLGFSGVVELSADQKLKRFLAIGHEDEDVVDNPTNEDITDILSHMHRHRRGYID